MSGLWSALSCRTGGVVAAARRRRTRDGVASAHDNVMRAGARVGRSALAGLVVAGLALAGLLAEPAAAAMDGGAASGRAASWAEQQSARCAAAVAAAEGRHGTAAGLLGAIAKAESGRPVPPLPGLQPWPWAVNADGAAMYFDSKAAAVAWTRLALERGVRQVDVGCLQVNLQSHPGAFATLETAFEPTANADYAARFLKSLQEDAGGNWYVATGYYHSRTSVLAADYRVRVAAIAAGRAPPAGLGVPLYVRAIQQGSLRIPLSGGGVLRLNVNRQPSARGRKRLTACEAAAVLGDYLARSARAGCAGRKPAAASREAGFAG